jgi:hypothetical protein
VRSYSVAVASLAVGAPQKWTDNAISQHRIEGVVSERRGVARRITFPALLTLAVARELVNSLQLSLANALTIAGDCTRASDEKDIRLGNITLRIDLQAVRRDLQQKLGDALESAPSPTRGRPRRDLRE